jgi:pimeloyl-ACP methyl ester carboxylesterase/ribosomal protein S18 acetylase RimI-like enzyme
MTRLQNCLTGLAITETGHGQPAVLLHGSASSGKQWRSLVLELSDRFRLVTPDLHGHGGSHPWSGPAQPTLDDEAATIAALADRLGEPIHLIGHSFGAAVALQFALAHPERLRSLVLIEPVAFHLLRHAGQAGARLLTKVEWLAAQVTRAAAEGTGSGMARFVDFWNGEGAWTRMPAERRAVVERCARPIAGHFAATLGNVTAPEAYHSLQVPTLLICGTESPTPVRCVAEMLVRLLPDVGMLRVQDAGHMLPLTHPEVVNPAIARHLDAAAAQAVRLRPLGADDLPDIESHLLALDATDRRHRFGSAVGDFAVAAYARGIDPARAVLFGAVDEPSGRILGLAEAQPGTAPGQVELAVSVHAEHRCRGLGRSLAGAAVAAAFARGAEVAEFLFAADNRAIAAMVHALGARIEVGGLCRGELRNS